MCAFFVFFWLCAKQLHAGHLQHVTVLVLVLALAAFCERLNPADNPVFSTKSLHSVPFMPFGSPSSDPPARHRSDPARLRGKQRGKGGEGAARVLQRCKRDSFVG